VDRVFIRAIFNVNAFFKEEVRGLENIFTGVSGKGQVMESATLTSPVIRVHDVIGFLCKPKPAGGESAGIKFHLLGLARFQYMIANRTEGVHIGSQIDNIIQTSYNDSTAGIA